MISISKPFIGEAEKSAVLAVLDVIVLLGTVARFRRARLI